MDGMPTTDDGDEMVPTQPDADPVVLNALTGIDYDDDQEEETDLPELESADSIMDGMPTTDDGDEMVPTQPDADPVVPNGYTLTGIDYDDDQWPVCYGNPIMRLNTTHKYVLANGMAWAFHELPLSLGAITTSFDFVKGRPNNYLALRGLVDDAHTKKVLNLIDRVAGRCLQTQCRAYKPILDEQAGIFINLSEHGDPVNVTTATGPKVMSPEELAALFRGRPYIKAKLTIVLSMLVWTKGSNGSTIHIKRRLRDFEEIV